MRIVMEHGTGAVWLGVRSGKSTIYQLYDLKYTDADSVREFMIIKR